MKLVSTFKVQLALAAAAIFPANGAPLAATDKNAALDLAKSSNIVTTVLPSDPAPQDHPDAFAKVWNQQYGVGKSRAERKDALYQQAQERADPEGHYKIAADALNWRKREARHEVQAETGINLHALEKRYATNETAIKRSVKKRDRHKTLTTQDRRNLKLSDQCETLWHAIDVVEDRENVKDYYDIKVQDDAARQDRIAALLPTDDVDPVDSVDTTVRADTISGNLISRLAMRAATTWQKLAGLRNSVTVDSMTLDSVMTVKPETAQAAVVDSAKTETRPFDYNTASYAVKKVTHLEFMRAPKKQKNSKHRTASPPLTPASLAAIQSEQPVPKGVKPVEFKVGIYKTAETESGRSPDIHCAVPGATPVGIYQFSKKTIKDLRPKVGKPFPADQAMATPDGLRTQTDYFSQYFKDNHAEVTTYDRKRVAQGKKALIGRQYIVERGNTDIVFTATPARLAFAMHAGPGIIEGGYIKKKINGKKKRVFETGLAQWVDKHRDPETLVKIKKNYVEQDFSGRFIITPGDPQDREHDRQTAEKLQARYDAHGIHKMVKTADYWDEPNARNQHILRLAMSDTARNDTASAQLRETADEITGQFSVRHDARRDRNPVRHEQKIRTVSSATSRPGFEPPGR